MLLVLALVAMLLLSGGVAGWQTCTITDFDPSCAGDGASSCTQNIRAAIAKCGSGGGGEVVVPKGRWLSAPFNLTSNMVLRLDPGAVLLGTNYTSIRLPPLPSMGGSVAAGGGGPHWYPCRWSPLVGAANATNVTISGGGRVDGQGPSWWNYDDTGCRKPMLMEFWYVNGLTIAGISVHNSPFWNIHPYFSRDIHIHHVNITADPPGNAHFNTDGIDPDSCENVLIEDYYYCAGDDAIAIKSGWNIAGMLFGKPSRNITVRRSSSGCRGGWTIGSEMSGGVEDVLFEDLVSTSESGIRISAELDRGGYVKNVTFRNLSFSWAALEKKSFLFEIEQEYPNSGAFPPCKGCPIPSLPENVTTTNFTGLHFEDIAVLHAPKGLQVGRINCTQAACRDVTLKRITLVDAPGPSKLACMEVHGVQVDDDPAAVPPGCVLA